MKTLEGHLEAKGLRFAIVVGKFNQHISSHLLEGAKSTLLKAGVAEDDITVVFAPGSFEIPLLAKQLALTKKVDAVITLGCVLKGGTYHFEYICHGVTYGIQQAILDTGIPVTFGILMADTADQALERAGGRLGNKGEEVARAAIEMATVLKNISTAL
ncbi:MAG: 6,7-dimethyl-8-ribityllumazine synthase [Deltaproteobacteria bacterium RIFCSPLOWO2_01_44_7]|nr:MAG: 6,7-dimethyl-8-ribityllumazine synthase [Deltaproteobacteria bacterium RIFCSPHIGHO2_01_FULL_43_49]OGQ15628.1 MAG: 6,7-dimethyl-8-ribityllumazine synthase [Deltaproteobacteria bacterium RIFCSPHIGHO2_02_FULL_44_53]OGQ28597.1 MAG: 6,7-dimethyl-8-ribityllumazine synthase [Deltaproteobacteria bacterium RIFCSPHIGHO2_12_FULL_44_21]OGQ31919.1 MAG: 6,7-dimethyl-8-ribityllumazine synthase [Deltaproteobacteria bacterium RIFCSPLOWO2_01_FULL_45_74]OGQ38461.1 MAG: 6,7-dimethyl-8-ribityllumazine synth